MLLLYSDQEWVLNFSLLFYCIPTKEVIKYFDLDIEFLKSIAYFNKEINDVLPK